MLRRPVLALLALLVVIPACFSYAPPVRLAHMGAPGRIGAGSFDIAAAVTSSTGAQALAYGISDHLAVEGGVESDFSRTVMGSAGLRFTPLGVSGASAPSSRFAQDSPPAPRRRKHAFVLDVEGGIGAGVGGHYCDAEGKCSSAAQDLRRAAGGGYLGLGVGAKLSFFSPYLRVRQQLTGAQGVPMTSYTSLMPGVQFSILETVHLWAGTGYLVIATREGKPFSGWLSYDVGLSLAFGGWRQAEAKQRWQQRERRRAR